MFFAIFLVFQGDACEFAVELTVFSFSSNKVQYSCCTHMIPRLCPLLIIRLLRRLCSQYDLLRRILWEGEYKKVEYTCSIEKKISSTGCFFIPSTYMTLVLLQCDFPNEKVQAVYLPQTGKYVDSKKLSSLGKPLM